MRRPRSTADPPLAQPVLTADQGVALQRRADEVFVHQAVAEYGSARQIMESPAALPARLRSTTRSLKRGT